MIFLKKIIDSIFPDRCVGCRTRGYLLCTTCQKKLQPAISPEQTFITSIFSYTNPSIRKLIHILKYKSGYRVAKIFAPYVYMSLVEFLGEEKLLHGTSNVLLVPVPLTKKREKSRGYNQSEILIRAIIHNDTTKTLLLENKLVAKIKDTAPQAEIKKRTERLKSQKNCFVVLPNKRTKSEIVILVDDVTTTGATLCEIRDVLKKNGFKKVYALTIAH